MERVSRPLNVLLPLRYLPVSLSPFCCDNTLTLRNVNRYTGARASVLSQCASPVPVSCRSIVKTDVFASISAIESGLSLVSRSAILTRLAGDDTCFSFLLFFFFPSYIREANMEERINGSFLRNETAAAVCLWIFPLHNFVLTSVRSYIRMYIEYKRDQQALHATARSLCAHGAFPRYVPRLRNLFRVAAKGERKRGGEERENGGRHEITASANCLH